jgi:hypothetical protein
VLEELEIRSRRPERLTEHGVRVREVLHAHAPRGLAVAARNSPVAQRALNGARGLLAAEMRFAVDQPFLAVLRDEVAVEEPEGAFVHGRADLRARYLKHAVVVFEQVHAREVAREPRANRRLGRRGLGVARAQRGRVCRRGRLMYQRRRHGRATRAAADGARILLSRRTRRRILLLVGGRRRVKTDAGQAGVNVRRGLAGDPVMDLRHYNAF